MKKGFVINELSEIDSNYNNCNGIFLDEAKARDKMQEVVDRAISDIGEGCIIEDNGTCDGGDETFIRVYNDDYSVTVNLDHVEIYE